MSFIHQLAKKMLVFFKLIEENTQIYLINTLSKNSQGLTVISIGTQTDNKLDVTSIEILNNHLLKQQLNKKDLKLVEALIMSEGDIIIDSKEYKLDLEFYNLRSLITNERWLLSKEQILNDNHLLVRLNRQYFKYSPDF